MVGMGKACGGEGGGGGGRLVKGYTTMGKRVVPTRGSCVGPSSCSRSAMMGDDYFLSVILIGYFNSYRKFLFFTE